MPTEGRQRPAKKQQQGRELGKVRILRRVMYIREEQQPGKERG
jgi:hypothetical protein